MQKIIIIYSFNLLLHTTVISEHEEAQIYLELQLKDLRSPRKPRLQKEIPIDALFKEHFPFLWDYLPAFIVRHYEPPI